MSDDNPLTVPASCGREIGRQRPGLHRTGRRLRRGWPLWAGQRPSRCRRSASGSCPASAAECYREGESLVQLSWYRLHRFPRLFLELPRQPFASYDQPAGQAMR
eukprot:scaffold633_cov288-Ochromonas_danica.AAC.87